MLKNGKGFRSVVQVVGDQSKVLCVNGAHRVDQADFAGCRPDVADHSVQDIGRSVIRLGGVCILSLARLQLGECLQTQWEQIKIAAILRGIGCGCGQRFRFR